MNPICKKLIGFAAVLCAFLVIDVLLMCGSRIERATHPPARLWLSITPNSVTIQRLRENTPPEIIFNQPVPTNGAIGKALDLRP